MLNFLAQAGLAMLPSLLGHFQKDPSQQYRQNVANLLSPANMGRLSQQYFQQGLGSPAYALGQRQISAGTNATMGNLASNAGLSGLSQSGLGNLMASIGPSLAGGQLANLNAGLWNASQQMAQNNIQNQIQALSQSMPISQNQGLFAGGLAALGPLLQQYMQSRQPGMGGGGMPSMNYLRGAAGLGMGNDLYSAGLR